MSGAIHVPGQGDRTVIGGIIFFDDDARPLNQDQTDRLKIIAAELAGKPQEVEVLGHASRRPLPPGSPFQDRWDLAYARCRQTVRLLRELKIDPARLRIGVVGQRPASAAARAGQDEDAQVDIYLTDLLPEKYTAASATPKGPALFRELAGNRGLGIGARDAGIGVVFPVAV